MLVLRSCLSGSLSGDFRVPGDKSMSHRALILGVLSCGETKVFGLLEGDDVLATCSALVELGGEIDFIGKGNQEDIGRHCLIRGVGLGGFKTPERPLDLGNSGTGIRLLMGVIAGSGITAIFTGDASLSGRPMARIAEPLSSMGAKITLRDGQYLPLTIAGTSDLRAIHWHSPVASAQIKSAVLLAGLTARGETAVTEPAASRDHTESMLRHFGVEVETELDASGHYTAKIKGEARLTARDISVPCDPSSAAFPAVAALIVPDSHIVLRNVCTNPLRFGLFETLIEMGADIRLMNQRLESFENVADLEIRYSQLKGVEVPADRAASMIDEFPILSVAAAFAKGKTVMTGIGELRVKETDRIKLMADGLAAAGVVVETTADSMTITGNNSTTGDNSNTITGGIDINPHHDHRIAMSFLVLGLACAAPITVSGAETIATSFPGFADLLRSAGANITESGS